MPASVTSGSLPEFVQFLANAVVVVAGWWVVHLLTARRDRQKARRELIADSTQDLIDALTQLMTSAYEYHTNERDTARENAIKMSIQDIAMSIQGLAGATTQTDVAALNDAATAVSRIRAAITGAHFEDEHTAALSREHRLLQSIAERISQGKRALSVLKHRQFL
jgi:hypothetical protein